jgi:hypothetical protein
LRAANVSAASGREVAINPGICELVGRWDASATRLSREDDRPSNDTEATGCGDASSSLSMREKVCMKPFRSFGDHTVFPAFSSFCRQGSQF